MDKRMLINAVETEECRIAILENNVLEELYIEMALTSRVRQDIRYVKKPIFFESNIDKCCFDTGF
ncbi:MAG: ribonuclease E, partial [Planctomycetes bacterium]|nr:ribonuclease E [Planctomycetota bacterium]